MKATKTKGTQPSQYYQSLFLLRLKFIL